MSFLNTNEVQMLKIERAHSLREAEIAEISKLDGLWMRHYWSRSQWEEEFLGPQSKRSVLFLLKDDEGAIKGLNLYSLNPWIHQAHLLKIALDDKLKGSGAAKRLFDGAVDWMKNRADTDFSIHEIYLEVAINNTRAINFYRKMGFTELCEKKGFYSDGADAMSMLLSL